MFNEPSNEPAVGPLSPTKEVRFMAGLYEDWDLVTVTAIWVKPDGSVYQLDQSELSPVWIPLEPADKAKALAGRIRAVASLPAEKVRKKRQLFAFRATRDAAGNWQWMGGRVKDTDPLNRVTNGWKPTVINDKIMHRAMDFDADPPKPGTGN